MDEKAFRELAQRAVKRGIPLFSRFLNLSEQKMGEIAAQKEGVAFRFFGGKDDCERRILGFGADEAPEEKKFPIACLMASPKNARFAAPVTHRDVLGALMGLQIDRETIGDICVRPEGAYIFCMEQMAQHIMDELLQIGRTDVRCIHAEPPEGALRHTVPVRVQISSPRLDAVIAHLFHLSRDDAQALFRQGRVLVDDAECERPDYQLKEGQIISVRRFGRARYDGILNISKKGKLNACIALYTDEEQEK